VRVVELSQLLAAPLCGLTLHDLGADVVKVEPPRGGDPARAFPPFVGDGAAPESAFFHALNRGKRSVTADLRDEADRAFVARLVERADIVVENLGDAARALPVSAEEAVAADPALVWCSITGWGRGAEGRAVDPSLQAALGLMSITGERDGPPLRVPVPLVDFSTGLYAGQSVLAALLRRERTGRGAVLDCALADAAAMLTSTSALLAAGGRLEPRRVGGESHVRVPSALFAAADGRHVQIVCVTERHWRGLCRALGHPEWAEDPRCADSEARLANRDLVHGRIAEVVATEPAETWLAALPPEGVICELVRDIADGWRDPRLRERGLVGRTEDPSLAELPMPVVSLARTADADALERGPRLGEHTDEVRRELR
jgi:crotonobetainyl-CoA:carnitine CoA-transferase CaiB-like acyl-CoA transferase